MKKHTMKTAVFAATVSAAALMASAGSHADSFSELFKVSQASTEAGQASQKTIDKLADETRDLLQEYKTVMKQVDGLKVYNARLEKQITNQEKRMASIDRSIGDVTVIQRQITPLVERMIQGLEEFINLDLPFDLEERQQRVEFLRGNLDRADVTAAEKFRQVLEAYKIENEYGRKISFEETSVTVNGSELQGTILQIGRVALLFQTLDQQSSAFWNKEAGAWESLDNSTYGTVIRDGIRMARKEASIDLLTLPISAPETI
jgi:predicted RNase H-like nuclease (RuvC/YqgF family)